MTTRRQLITGLISFVAAAPVPVRLWKPDSGKFYFETEWQGPMLLNAGPSFELGLPEGFKPGQVVKLAIDENKLWWQISNGEGP